MLAPTACSPRCHENLFAEENRRRGRWPCRIGRAWIETAPPKSDPLTKLVGLGLTTPSRVPTFGNITLPELQNPISASLVFTTSPCMPVASYRFEAFRRKPITVSRRRLTRFRRLCARCDRCDRPKYAHIHPRAPRPRRSKAKPRCAY